jgi:hypothetical protein
MAEYVQEPGTFTLWIDQVKRNSRGPDYRLTAVLPDGKSYEFAGWVHQAKQGQRISGTIKEVHPQQGKESQPEQPPAARPVSHFTPEDDAPF